MRQSILAGFCILIGLAIAGPVSAQVLIVPPHADYGIGLDRDGHARPLPMPPGIGPSPGMQVVPFPFMNRETRRKRPPELWERNAAERRREMMAPDEQTMQLLEQQRRRQAEDDTPEIWEMEMRRELGIPE